ncbi:hypothetical protein DICVIV_09154 [Dictyocaulus viviparus]|uniref:Endoplasmic reticulum metallopeptidase 1-like C-terminal domain-containing protein n=1 Tax=Dictyocaulus viviparus TaxID=29172 RepID=A0A0D8XJR5_DICVI|nr:hypothetical protein DICVIV_09154 [Dictyocaulus viviparus]
MISLGRCRSRISRYIRYKVLDETLSSPMTKITLINKEEQGKVIIYDFLLKGAEQMSIFVVPQKGWQIANCSLSVPKSTLSESTLFIFLTCSSSNCDWTFRITLKHGGDPNENNETELLLGVANHHLHGPYMQSTVIKRLLSEISMRRQSDPSWSMAVPKGAGHRNEAAACSIRCIQNTI